MGGALFLRAALAIVGDHPRRRQSSSQQMTADAPADDSDHLRG